MRAYEIVCMYFIYIIYISVTQVAYASLAHICMKYNNMLNDVIILICICVGIKK